VKSCDSYVNPESGIAAKMAAYEDALRSPDVAATPSSREVSDERALDLARHIQDGDFTTEEAACEIMMYATDGAMQLKAAGYFDPAQPSRNAVIEECAKVAESYPSSGEQTEHPVEYWIRRLSISSTEGK
jgi:hypothetical protein